MPLVSRFDTQFCKQIALWAWVAFGAAFLFLMYASFGWIGPAPAFLIWTTGALPLFLATWWWQVNVGMTASPRPAVLTLFVWLVLAASIPLIKTPVSQAPNIVQWLLMGALVIFPVALSWHTIKTIDDYRPGSRGAA